MNDSTIFVDLIILYIGYFLITWFVVNYLGLDAWKTFAVFSVLNAFNGVLQTFLLPLHYLEEIRKTISTVNLFGAVSLGLLVGQINIGILWNKFGLQTALLIAFGSVAFAPLLYWIIESVKNARRSKLTETPKSQW